MPLHDRYARVTPYELFLPDERFAGERFPAIEDEAAERGVDLSDPEAFVMLMAAGEALRELRGPDDDPGRIRQHGRLLFHAFHFWRASARVHLLDTHATRYLVESDPEPAAPAAPATYLQLPQHLFWAREAGSETPVSVDGLFTAQVGGRLTVLVCMGLRGDRPGFGVAPLPSVPVEEAVTLAGTPIREEGRDFASRMPGAELEGLYELTTPGEVLKLAVLALGYVATADADLLERHEAGDAGDAGAESPSGPRPTRLPWVHVRLG